MADWLGKNFLGQTDKAAVAHSGGLSVKVNITLHEEAPKSAEDKTCLPDRQAGIDVTEVRQANRLLEGLAPRLADGGRAYQDGRTAERHYRSMSASAPYRPGRVPGNPSLARLAEPRTRSAAT